MHRSRLFSGLAASVAATATVSFAALTPGIAHAEAVVPGNASAFGTDSTATATGNGADTHWMLMSGPGSASAQVQVVRALRPLPTDGPTFTTSPAAAAGNPRWVLTFHNACIIVGSPPHLGTTFTDTSWHGLGGGGAPHNATFATALAWADGSAAGSHCGHDNAVTSAFIVLDSSNANTEFTLTDVTYNGLPVVPDTTPARESGTGLIRNFHSGLCLDVTGGVYAAGTMLQQWTCGATGTGRAGGHQDFRYVRRVDGTGYLLARSPHGQLWGVTTNGLRNQLELTTSRANMLKHGPFYTFPDPAAEDLNMDVAGHSTVNGGRVIGFTATTGLNQQWSLP